MSMEDTLVLAMYMPCDYCPARSDLFLSGNDLLKALARDGWTDKSFTKNNKLVEKWACPCCSQSMDTVQQLSHPFDEEVIPSAPRMPSDMSPPIDYSI